MTRAQDPCFGPPFIRHQRDHADHHVESTTAPETGAGRASNSSAHSADVTAVGVLACTTATASGIPSSRSRGLSGDDD
jgi:hypothetical protein